MHGLPHFYLRIYMLGVNVERMCRHTSRSLTQTTTIYHEFHERLSSPFPLFSSVIAIQVTKAWATSSVKKGWLSNIKGKIWYNVTVGELRSKGIILNVLNLREKISDCMWVETRQHELDYLEMCQIFLESKSGYALSLINFLISSEKASGAYTILECISTTQS